MIRFTHVKRPGYAGFTPLTLRQRLSAGTLIITSEGSFRTAEHLYPNSDCSPPTNLREAMRDRPSYISLVAAMRGLKDALDRVNEIPPIIRPGMLVDGFRIVTQSEFEQQVH